MNYLKQLNEFADKRLEEPLNPNAVLLYFILMEYANKVRWKKWFSAPNLALQVRTGGLSRQQIDRARSELVQKGYIEYKKSSGNQAGRYLMVEFDTQGNTPDDTHDNIQNDTQCDIQTKHEVTTLNKLNINKTKQKSSTNVLPKESPVPYQEIMGLFNSICKSYGEIRSIAGKRKEMVAARWKQFESLKDFEDVFTNAEQSRFMQGENQRNWKADFDWIMKPSNFQKVLEGNYANRSKPEAERKYTDTSYDLSELEERLMHGPLTDD